MFLLTSKCVMKVKFMINYLTLLKEESGAGYGGTCNRSTLETEAEWPHTRGQLMLCRETLSQKGTLDELDRLEDSF